MLSDRRLWQYAYEIAPEPTQSSVWQLGQITIGLRARIGCNAPKRVIWKSLAHDPHQDPLPKKNFIEGKQLSTRRQENGSTNGLGGWILVRVSGVYALLIESRRPGEYLWPFDAAFSFPALLLDLPSPLHLPAVLAFLAASRSRHDTCRRPADIPSQCMFLLRRSSSGSHALHYFLHLHTQQTCRFPNTVLLYIH